MTIWSHDDPVPGMFNDGAFPVDRPVHVRQTMGELIIEDKDTGEALARWPLGTLRPVPDADFPATMRLRQSDGEGGRLAVFDRAFNEGLTEWWPNLNRRLVLDRSTLGIAGRVSLTAFLGIAFFFLVLLPTMGRLAADLVPPSLEQRTAAVFLRHGDPLLQRINSARVCDMEPVAPIMDKLVEPLRVASGWPGNIHIRVIDDRLPNAAAMPGGEIVLFRGMLNFAQNADELAGILAHEMGHVAGRHAVRNLFVTSLNFFGLDQLLGNFSGQLVVHPLSGLVLNRREGRRAEYEADRLAMATLEKAGFNVRPLADILDRVAYLQGESEVANGWLATHPLSRRRSRMIRDGAPAEPRPHALTAAEFGRLRAMCGPLPDAAGSKPGEAEGSARSGEPEPAAGKAESGTEALPDKAPEPSGGSDEEQADSPAPDLDEWDTGT